MHFPFALVPLWKLGYMFIFFLCNRNVHIQYKSDVSVVCCIRKETGGCSNVNDLVYVRIQSCGVQQEFE